MSNKYNQENKSYIKGDYNIVIQGVSDSHITIEANGEIIAIKKDFNRLYQKLQELQCQNLQLKEQLLDFNQMSVSDVQNAILNSDVTVGGNMHIGNVIQYHLHNESRKIPRLLTNNIPTQADNIIGREVELQKTHHFLQEHKPTALVNGMGGIGKTAVATKYIAQHLQDYQHFAWLTVQSSHQDNPLSQSIADTFTSNLPLLDSLGIPQKSTNCSKRKPPTKPFKWSSKDSTTSTKRSW